MTDPKIILEGIPGGRVLDVATGAGGFIQFLLEGLLEYDEIIGVDNSDRAADAFEGAFKENPKIHFRRMAASSLEFPDESFDLVCISNSLHHLDPLPVLHEMLRVLRPGGILLVSEMYRDHQSETQMTHVHLHHWWAAVDTVNGILHRETYMRQELLDLTSGLGLRELCTYDLSDLDENPLDPAILSELAPVFDRYIQRAQGHPKLQARGLELRQRIEQVGFHSASTLVIKGRKAGMAGEPSAAEPPGMDALLKEFESGAESWKPILTSRYGSDFSDGIVKESLEEFQRLIPNIPFIGGDQSWSDSLNESVKCLALYITMKKHGRSAEETGRILYDAILAGINDHPAPPAASPRLTDGELMERRKKRADASRERAYAGGYVCTFIPGDGQEFDYGYDFTECAALKFFQRQDADEFMPYYCFLDFPKSRAAGLGLRRTMTLAEGCPKCDHRFKRGRPTDVDWPPPFLKK